MCLAHRTCVLGASTQAEGADGDGAVPDRAREPAQPVMVARGANLPLLCPDFEHFGVGVGERQ